MIVKLLTEHHLEFLSIKGGCRGSSESTLVKLSNYWNSHAADFPREAEVIEPTVLEKVSRVEAEELIKSSCLAVERLSKVSECRDVFPRAGVTITKPLALLVDDIIKAITTSED